jgi:hypothetical protein
MDKQMSQNEMKRADGARNQFYVPASGLLLAGAADVQEDRIYLFLRGAKGMTKGLQRQSITVE